MVDLLRVESIETEYDQRLLSLSPLVVRSIRDRTESGTFVEYPELQFQVTNVSSKPLVELDAAVNYYRQSGEFAGSDCALRWEPLMPAARHTFSLFIEPPEGVARAHLTLKARTKSPFERVPETVRVGAWVVIAGLFVYQTFFK
jgi:hypothetical protein